MTRRIVASEIFDDVYIDLWGSPYKLRTITKTVSEKLTDAQRVIQSLDDETSTSDQTATALIDMIDVLLEPAPPTAEDKVEPAGKILLGLWKKDELGVDWLMGFSATLNEEADARRRPTSKR